MKEIDLSAEFDLEALVKKIVQTIKDGGLVAMPSDTCYGFVADFENPVGREKLYAIKDMPADKPTSICVADKEMFLDYAALDQVGLEILEIYMPGRLTMVVDQKNSSEMIGLRLPDHALMCAVAKELGHGFFTTSANVHGKESPYSVDQIKEQFGDLYQSIDLVIDAGVLDYNEPSTVVRIKDGKLNTLREGELSEVLRLNYSYDSDSAQQGDGS
jgi:L-threonylcarbamoyladenylate synthase